MFNRDHLEIIAYIVEGTPEATDVLKKAILALDDQGVHRSTMDWIAGASGSWDKLRERQVSYYLERWEAFTSTICWLRKWGKSVKGAWIAPEELHSNKGLSDIARWAKVTITAGSWVCIG